MERQMHVADLMTRNIVSVGPGTGIRHAAELMLKHRVSGLPVIDDSGTLVGMVTEGDLLRRLQPFLPGPRAQKWSEAGSPAGAARDFVKRRSWRVSDVMTTPVVTITETASVADAAQVLDTRAIKRLPVLRNGHLVGLLSRADLLHCVADERPPEIARGDDALRLSIATSMREAETILGTPPTVIVWHGVVHLWGALPSEASRDAARVIAENVPGTAGVEDHTTIP